MKTQKNIIIPEEIKGCPAVPFDELYGSLFNDLSLAIDNTEFISRAYELHEFLTQPFNLGMLANPFNKSLLHADECIIWDTAEANIIFDGLGCDEGNYSYVNENGVVMFFIHYTDIDIYFKTYNELSFNEGGAVYYKEIMDKRYRFPQPKTLNDFLVLCKGMGIILTWIK